MFTKIKYLLIALLGISYMSTIQSDSKTIYVGAIYRHYKGNLYEIVCRAWMSEHDKLIPAIVYQGIYTNETLGKNPIFVQSEERFLQPTTIDGKDVDRFSLVYESLPEKTEKTL